MHAFLEETSDKTNSFSVAYKVIHVSFFRCCRQYDTPHSSSCRPCATVLCVTLVDNKLRCYSSPSLLCYRHGVTVPAVWSAAAAAGHGGRPGATERVRPVPGADGQPLPRPPPDRPGCRLLQRQQRCRHRPPQRYRRNDFYMKNVHAVIRCLSRLTCWWTTDCF